MTGSADQFYLKTHFTELSCSARKMVRRTREEQWSLYKMISTPRSTQLGRKWALGREIRTDLVWSMEKFFLFKWSRQLAVRIESHGLDPASVDLSKEFLVILFFLNCFCGNFVFLLRFTLKMRDMTKYFPFRRKTWKTLWDMILYGKLCPRYFMVVHLFPSWSSTNPFSPTTISHHSIKYKDPDKQIFLSPWKMAKMRINHLGIPKKENSEGDIHGTGFSF